LRRWGPAVAVLERVVYTRPVRRFALLAGTLIAASALLAASGCAVHGRPPAHPSHHRPGLGSDAAVARHSFADVEHWKGVFDDPKRDEWQKPAQLVAALELRPGMRVADLGAGTGYFSRHLAAVVGEGGTVFAVDTEPNLVAYLRERSEKEGIANVIPILGSADNPRLPAGGSDLILIVDTYHHIDGRVAYFQRLRRALAPNGRVAIVDWHKRDLPVGPPPAHKLAREQFVEEMGAAGYELVAEPALLPYQYFLIFQPR
jgi:SAM-dependent methyltransferase